MSEILQTNTTNTYLSICYHTAEKQLCDPYICCHNSGSLSNKTALDFRNSITMKDIKAVKQMCQTMHTNLSGKYMINVIAAWLLLLDSCGPFY